MSKQSSFGRQVLLTQSVETFLQIERDQAKNQCFADIDLLHGQLFFRGLRGEHVIAITRTKQKNPTFSITELGSRERNFIDTTFSFALQQSRGVWFLPSESSLQVGFVHYAYHFYNAPRFAGNSVVRERYKVSLETSADALFIWALLEPCFDAMLQPFILRGEQNGNKSKEEQIKIWAEIDDLYDNLGFSVPQELRVMRYGGGWHKLRVAEQIEAKEQLFQALARQVKSDTSERYRAYCLRKLIAQYYKKAKADGKAKRSQVVSKAFERTLVGFFGGDWLAFLDYLGEEPHPDEQIITAIAPVQIQVGGKTRAAEVAAQMGLPIEEVENMMAAYWQGESSVSPVEQRIAVMRRYWQIFDDIHARQSVGMTPLWGLIEDGTRLDFYNLMQGPYQARLYQQLLPSDLLSEIEQLWGTVMLAQWPDRIVSEAFPHQLFRKTFGLALDFWHGCALTAWFLCEGPSSRTDMPGLSEYYRREREALREIGTPLPEELFDALIRAETLLGPPQPLNHSSQIYKGAAGISIELTMHHGQRRDGFEKLRDIITFYRHQWTSTYLTRYLQALCEKEIRGAGHAYSLLMNEKSKAPTAKQFAKAAVSATNHWFGGDMSKLYGAIQEKSPVQPHYKRQLPDERYAFAYTVFSLLGGSSYENKDLGNHHLDYQIREQEQTRYWQYCELASLNLWYVQLEEIYGRAPDQREFGMSKFSHCSAVIHQDTDMAWSTYAQVIKAAKQNQFALPERRGAPIRGSALPGSPTSSPHKQSPINQSSEEKHSWLQRILKRKPGK